MTRRLPPLALKTLTYGIIHFAVAIAVAYALTRDWRAALAIGIVEPFVQMFAFAAHERVWAARGRLQARVSTVAPAPAPSAEA